MVLVQQVTTQVEQAAIWLGGGGVMFCFHYSSLILSMIWDFLELFPYSHNQSLDATGADCISGF